MYAFILVAFMTLPNGIASKMVQVPSMANCQALVQQVQALDERITAVCVQVPVESM